MPESEKAKSAMKAGRLCLEFANTLKWHARENPEETLHSYADLIDWARSAGALPEPESRQLPRAAAGRPAETARAFRRAIALRETIYRIFVAVSGGKPPAGADLAGLNAALVRLTGGARIVQTADGFAWDWSAGKGGLDEPLRPVVLSAAELLVSEERGRVGQCADDRGCGLLFLDTSKNRSRRWCDITDCGNRARQRRHHERTRGPSKSA